MVQAILAGNKTQTRRIIPENIVDEYYSYDDWCTSVMPKDINCSRMFEKEFFMNKCKYSVGDILWVRETFIPTLAYGTVYSYIYKATNDLDCFRGRWKPSIFMPKEACRIFLKLTNIRVERLNDISENDSLMEGIQAFTKHNGLFKHGLDGWEWQSMPKYAKEAYKMLWEKINGKGSWDLNPYVWVYDFERDYEFHF